MIILPSNSVNSPVHLWGQLSPAKALQNWSAGTPIHDIYSMMLLDWIDITTDITACNRYHWDMLARHCHTCKSPAKQVWNIEALWFFVENLKYCFFSVWREWSVCFRSPAASLVDGFSSFRKMPSASHIVGKLNRHVHHPAWKPPSLDALRFAEIQTANAPLSPISDSNLLWSKLDLAEERDRRNWPNWLVVSNIWVYESGIYPESTPFNGH